MNPLQFSNPVDLHDIKVSDSFWRREMELVRNNVIPYQWDALNDRVPGAAPSWCMHNFRAAARLQHRKTTDKTFIPPVYTATGFETSPASPEEADPDAFYGFVFQDTDFSKWIEAVGYSLAQHPDAELEKLADGIKAKLAIDDIGDVLGGLGGLFKKR